MGYAACTKSSAAKGKTCALDGRYRCPNGMARKTPGGKLCVLRRQVKREVPTLAEWNRARKAVASARASLRKEHAEVKHLIRDLVYMLLEEDFTDAALVSRAKHLMISYDRY